MRNILVVFLLLFSLSTIAADFIINDISYNILSSNEPRRVEVTYGRYYNENIIIPSEVTYNDTTYTVTKIGYYAFDFSPIISIELPNTIDTISYAAFNYCFMLDSIIIPNSVTYIDEGAFYNCESLRYIELSNSLEQISYSTFSNCYSLLSITIPNSVNKIESYAFYHCYSLSEIQLSNTLDTIGNYAFSGIDSIPNITLPASLSYFGIGNSSNFENIYIENGNEYFSSVNGVLYTADTTSIVAFPGLKNTLQLPNTITIIPDYAFANSDIMSIEIPNTVTHIGENAFIYCTYLTSITIPNSVVELGESAFSYCYALRNITLSSSLFKINDYTFFNCDSLLTIEVPETVDSIGNSVFYGCHNLSSLILPNSLNYIGEACFRYCDSLTYFTFPESLSTISRYLFQYSGLTTINIPETIDSISSSAFSNCQNLNNVTIPNTIHYIHDYTFSNCNSLNSIELPSSIDSIGNQAFSNCDNLTQVNLPASLQKFDNMSFYRSNQISEINIETGNPYITSIDGVVYNNSITNLIYYPPAKEVDTVRLPESVNTIESGSFSYCHSIKTVDLTNNITTIGISAFYNSHIETIAIPNSISYIESRTFQACSTLVAVNLPASIDSIGRQTFDDCINLNSINCDATIPPLLYPYVFSDVPESAILIVPEQSRDLYAEADQWNVFEFGEGLLYNGIAFNITSSEEPYTAEVISRTPAYSGNIIIPSHAVLNGQRYTVTKIGENAFSDCNDLYSVTLPETIDTIANNALPISQLAYIKINSTTPPILIRDTSIISSVYYYNTFVFVPRESIEIYRSIPEYQIYYITDGFIESDLAFEITSSQEPYTAMLITRGNGYSGNLNVPSQVYHDNKAYSITGIGDNIFEFHYVDMSIQIPSTISYISPNAFSWCRTLKYIYVNPSNEHFRIINGVLYNQDTTILIKATDSIRNISIPNTVNYIENYALAYCDNLDSITIPASIDSLGYHSLYLYGIEWINCYAEQPPLCLGVLSDSTFSEGSFLNVPTHSLNAYRNAEHWNIFNIISATTLGNIVYNITSEVNHEVEILTTISISYMRPTIEIIDTIEIEGLPYTVKSIAENAFSNTRFRDIILPATIDYISVNAFSNNSRLRKIHIPNSVSYIEDNTFYNCIELDSVFLPASLTNFNINAFTECPSLIHFEICESNENYITIDGVIYNRDTTELIKCPYNKSYLYIPQTVTSLSEYALENCTAIEDITCLASIPPETLENSFSGIIKSRINLYLISNHELYLEDEDWNSFNIITDSFIHTGIFYEIIGDSSPPRLAVIGTTDEINNHVTIPQSFNFHNQIYTVSKINNGALINDNIITIDLPSSIDTIEPEAFNQSYSRCSNLNNININSGNPIFSSVNGLLYNNDTTILYFCPFAKDSVNIANTVHYIADRAFYYCDDLKVVSLPESLDSIGYNAFYYCSDIKYIRLNSSFPPIIYGNIYEADTRFFPIYIPANSYADYNSTEPWSSYNITYGFYSEDLSFSITSDTIPFTVCIDRVSESYYIHSNPLPSEINYQGTTYSVTSIGDNTFLNYDRLSDWTQIKSLHIPETIISVGDLCFSNFSNLDSIFLPASLSHIGVGCFFNNDIKYISIDEENQNFIVIDNIIYSKDTSILVYCPYNHRNFEIPNTVSYIESYAFDNCPYLSYLIIPESIDSIGNKGIYYCNNLKILASESTIPPSTNSELFNIVNSHYKNNSHNLIRLVVPLNFKEIYDTTNLWDKFQDSYTGFIDSKIEYHNISQTDPYDVTIFDCFSYDNNIDDLIIHSNIEYDSVTYNITKIEEYALSELHYSNISIPNSIDSIGEYAFRDCSLLTNFQLPSSVKYISSTSFYGCDSLTSIIVDINNTEYMSINGILYNKDTTTIIRVPQKTDSIFIPETIQQIGDYAFQGCLNLTEITFPESLIHIGRSSFIGSSNITSITCNAINPPETESYSISNLAALNIPLYIPFQSIDQYSNTTPWNMFNIINTFTYDSLIFRILSSEQLTVELLSVPSSFSDSNVIPCNVQRNNVIWNITQIGERAFDNYSFNSLVIPDCISSIESEAFSNCINLTNISLPESLYSIGSSCFFNCNSLNSINIPNTVAIINSSAFANCSSLTQISIPERVTTINNSTFAGCSSLRSINLTNNITNINNSAFSGCSSLSYISIPESVNHIGESAFKNCTSLESISIPNNITSIPEEAFYNCTSLQSIELPEELTSIEDYAFANCGNLQTLILPENFSRFGNYVFDDCHNLNYIISRNTTPPEKDYSYSFPNNIADSIILLVPLESIEEYTYQYSDYFNVIPYSFEVNDILYQVIPTDTTINVEIAQKNPRYEGRIFIPTQVTYNNTTFNVSGIGEKAFWGCFNIESITCYSTIPPDVGLMAFHVVPDSVTLYVPQGSYSAYMQTQWRYFNIIEFYNPNATNIIEDNIIENSINVYPQVFSDDIFINLSTEISKCYFELINSKGEKVYESELTNWNNTIKTNFLHPGIYIYKIQTNRRICSGKLIKK